MICTPIQEGTWEVGDRVVHRKDSDLLGTVVSVDDPALSVMVLWEGADEPDFQWNEKLLPSPWKKS